MKVRTTASMAGVNFSFHHGQVVDEEHFAATIGNGWRTLCERVETPEKPKPNVESAVAPKAPEAAVKRPAPERRKAK